MVWVIGINTLVVVGVVMVHYECLHWLRVWLPASLRYYRARLVLGVFGALAAHVIEIWIFAFVYHLMHHAEGWGTLQGNFEGYLSDCAYFSFTAYTTLGFGDIEPIGDLRYLAGLEGLAGFVLLTWSASFLFLEMQRNWGRWDI